MRFLTKRTDGVIQLLEGITSFTGSPNQLIATSGLGFIDSSLLDVPSYSGFLPFGLNSRVNNTQFMRTATGTFSNVKPYQVESAGNIRAISAINRIGNNVGWTAETLVNGVVVNSLVIPGTTYKAIDSGLSLSVAVGDEISARFVSTSGQVRNPSILVSLEIPV